MATDLTPEQRDVQERFAEAMRPKPPPWETGITLGMPPELYHRRELGIVSKGGLDQMARSPAHYRSWVEGEEKEPTAAQRFGLACHMLMLEPQRFNATYVVEPDFGDCRYKEAKANRDAWRAEHRGKTSISADDERALLGMQESIMSHPAASRLVSEGVPEVTLRWVDSVTGLRCKARADYWVKRLRFAVDLKTTEDASADQWRRDVAKWRYQVQDALYRMGFAACGEQIDHFALVAVEKSPPYAVAVYTLDAEAVAKGYAATRRDMDRMAECVATNKWPAFSDVAEELSLPPWAA